MSNMHEWHEEKIFRERMREREEREQMEKDLHTGWVNIFRIPVTDEDGDIHYQTMSGNIIYKTREEAQKKDGRNSIDIIKIQWRE